MRSISRSAVGSGFQAINDFINILWFWLYPGAIRLNRLVKKVIDLCSYLIVLNIHIALTIPTLEVASPMPKDWLTNRFFFHFANEDIAFLILHPQLGGQRFLLCRRGLLGPGGLAIPFRLRFSFLSLALPPVPVRVVAQP